ncbi:MAG: FHA domain-containing protein [Prochlorotrichaceae cyanobacterium]
MLVCLHCNSQNPAWAIHCQACDMPLQPSVNCPNCGILVLKTANFCGQCGVALRQGSVEQYQGASSGIALSAEADASPKPVYSVPSLKAVASETPQEKAVLQENLPALHHPQKNGTEQSKPIRRTTQLLHQQSNQVFPLPNGEMVIYLGKPNDRFPPDIDLSLLPDGDVVSRVHARIVVDNQGYFLEDLGSSNGTYVNDRRLSTGEPYLLTKGDRIVFGKNNLVSFIFDERS